jgi:hypothetical protein
MSCSCENLKLGNLGLQGCTPIAKVARKLIYVNYFKDDGTVNTLDLNTALTAAAVTALINATDPSARWYPTGFFENVEQAQADPTYQTYNSGRKTFIHEGPRTFSGLIVGEKLKGTPFGLLAKYEEYGCSDLGAYIIDKEGNLIGDGSTADELRPIRIDEGTFYARRVAATDNGVENIMISFDWNELTKDSDLRMITAGEMTADLLPIEGLVDAYAEYSDIGQTSFTARLYTSYGSINNPSRVKNLVIGDFALYNVNDSLAVTISTMTEGTGDNKGIYTFTFASQTVTDVLRLTPTKAGFDFNNVVSNTITVES